MDVFIIFLLIIFIFFIVFLFFNIIFFVDKRNESINNFIKKVNIIIKDNGINISKEYTFNRFINYQKERISLGKIIFDDDNKQFLFYETFLYKKSKLLCIPDIRVFKYNELIKCSICNSDVSINDNSYINLYFKNNDIFVIRFFSVKNNETFMNLYYEFRNIINNNKKIV